MSTETAKPAFELLEDGTVVQNRKGKATTLAKFDEDTGHLEFASDDADIKFREQIIRAINEDTEGNRSKATIKSFSIAGREQDEPSRNEPPKPKGSKALGDKTPEVVEWYHTYRLQEFYVRYGVLLDKSGQPIRKHCLRREKELGENPLTGQIEQVERIVEDKRGYLATRATHLTFLKTEVVGAHNDNETED